MNDITSRKIKTGSNPRNLPDYAALCDEISKLTHPARPDVNWDYVETLCLSLFEQNGVELQTVAWYTLARTQLAGLYGLNEGLAILEALITHQWGVLWPQPVHARMEILSYLGQRLQQLMRRFSLNYSDLNQLYRAEQLFISIETVLQRLELKHLSQFGALRNLMHNSAARLENSNGTADSDAAVQPDNLLNVTEITGTDIGPGGKNAVQGATKRQLSDRVKWVYIAQSEQQPKVDVLTAMPVPVKKWTFFATGMCTMLVINIAAVWGWQYFHQTDPLQSQLAATLAPLPATLTPVQIDHLRQHRLSPQSIIEQTQQQLSWLGQLAPDWNLMYSRQLAAQIQGLWPEQTPTLLQQWQQQINVSALSENAIGGWHQGMTQLQTLTDKLNALDGQKGKYITVSELKSQVFGMMTNFRQTVPLEEQFRQLKQLPEDSPLRMQLIRQAEQHLRAQTFTLAQEKQRK